MSPTSEALERMAARFGVPVLDLVEYFNERAAIREYEGAMPRDPAEMLALTDCETWAKLRAALQGGGHSSDQLALPLELK